MNILEHFYIKTCKYDLLNKFIYNKSKDLPKLKRIVLNFGCKTAEIKELSSSLLALKLITNKNGALTRTTKSNIVLKIRKGYPAGCKVVLQKFAMFSFLNKLIIEIFPKLKKFNSFSFTNNNKNFFSCELHKILNFCELEDQYYLFSNLSQLNITIITNSESTKELIFILKSIQFPVKTK